MDRPRSRLDAMIDLRMELLQMTDAFYDKIKRVVDRVMSEVHDPAKDEGLLEIKIESYMECFHVDLAEFDSLLTKEVDSKRQELKKAEKAAD